MRTVLALCLALATLPAPAVELEVIDAGDHHQIAVQNESLRMVVVPEWGGRIMSLVDRGIDAELVWAEGMDGGALDDRDDFTGAAYRYRTELREGDTQAVVTLTGEALGGVQITKTLVVVDGRPLIEQRITVANGSQRPRRFWQRSFLRPGGEGLGPDDTFFLPTADGVVADPNMRGRHDEFTAGWAGVIDGATGHGILVIADLELLEQFYFWRGSNETPTFEWIGVEVAPGQKLSSRVWIALTSDVQAYSDDVVAGFVGPAWWRRGALQVDELPNWVDRRPRVEPGEEARARGFILYRTWGESPGAELTELRFDCPMRGSDSLTVQVAGFAEVDAHVAIEGDGAQAFTVRRADEDRNRLLPTPRLALVAEDVRPLQIVFDPGDAGPGELSARLVLTGAGGRTQTIALTGTVHPLRLPDRRLIWLKSYGGSVYMFTGGPKMEPENLERLEFFLDDGETMGNSVCEIIINPDQTLSRVRVRGTDLTIAETLERRPELFADLSRLPALDFTFLNPWIHRSQLHGFRWAETHAPPPGRSNTLALIHRVAGAPVAPESEAYRRIYVWYLRELGRWMLERGWPEVAVKIADEISPDAVPGWITTATLCRQAGLRPYTTITGNVAGTPDLLNAMNPVADGWQVQWMSTQTFRDLTTRRYATRTERADISAGPWGAYGNGGARDTWATRPFAALGVDPGDLSEWRAFADGEELEKIGGPWGNTRRGVVAFTPPTLYVSLPDGGNPADGHTIEIEYTIRVEDPNGEVLVQIDPDDVVSFYTGGSSPFRIPYERSRGYAWFAAVNGYPGWGWWAYAHGWQATEHIVFREDGAPVRTPCWWGLRDGNQDADLLFLARAMIRRAREHADSDATRAALDAASATLDRLVGPDEGTLIRLEPRNYRGRVYFSFPQDGAEAGFREARRRVLGVIADLRTAFPEVDFRPDLYWGDTPVLAHDAPAHSLIPAMAGDPPWAATVLDGVAAARELWPREGADEPARTEPSFTLAVFDALPDAALLADYGLDADVLGLLDSYPPPGDYVILHAETGGRPCAVIIGGDADGALLGVRCFVKLLEPRW